MISWSLSERCRTNHFSLVNRVLSEVEGDGKSLELAKKIFQAALAQGKDIYRTALRNIKDEIRIYF